MRIDKCNCGDKLKTKDGRMAVYLGIAYSKEQLFTIAIFPGNNNYYIAECNCYGIVDGFPSDEIIGYWEDLLWKH